MKPQIISFHYTLTGTDGQTLDSSANRDPLTFMEGRGQIIPGLEKRLGEMAVGDKEKVSVPAAEAYGEHNPEMVVEVPRDRMPSKDIKVGDRFRTNGHPTPLTVKSVTASHVTLDANHPLAGMDLTFDVEVTGKREATEEELAQAHDCCGNHSHGCCSEEGKSGGCC